MDVPGDWEGRLRRIASFQFGRDAGPALFDDPIERVTMSSSGRPQQILGPTGRIATLGTDGRFTLGFAGGIRLQSALDFPAYRVVVGDESVPFIADGRNAFSKFVTDVDLHVRGGDEVLVVGQVSNDEGRRPLLGVGHAAIDAQAMLDFETGMAVAIREGADRYRNRVEG